MSNQTSLVEKGKQSRLRKLALDHAIRTQLGQSTRVCARCWNEWVDADVVLCDTCAPKEWIRKKLRAERAKRKLTGNNSLDE